MQSVIVVFSGGGQGRDVLDAVLAGGHSVAGVLDATASGPEVGGVRLLGRPSEWRNHAAPGVSFALGMGDQAARRVLGEELIAAGIEIVSVIHPAATISARAHLGRGVVVLAGCVIAPDASIGDFSILNANCAVDHDCLLGIAVQFGPGVTLAGGVRVDEGASLGVGVTVLPGVHIGAGAVAGAGAVVIRPVPAGVTVVGNPAKPLH